MRLDRLRHYVVQQGPQLLRLPLGVTPFALKKPLIEALLRGHLQQALVEGEVDFLSERWLGIEISDLDLRWSVTLADGQLRVADRAECDVWFRATAGDLLLIAARRRDPDTLFFQRRLTIEGDTELGLQVKNLMDALDPESMPTPLRIGLMQLADFVEAGMKQDAAPPEARAGIAC